jgi:flavorubredoxin
MFPFMKEFINHLTERNFQNRTIGMMENGSWAPTAVKVMTKMLEGSKNLTFTENNVKILSALSDASRAQIAALAEELMK